MLVSFAQRLKLSNIIKTEPLKEWSYIHEARSKNHRQQVNGERMKRFKVERWVCIGCKKPFYRAKRRTFDIYSHCSLKCSRNSYRMTVVARKKKVVIDTDDKEILDSIKW